MILVEKGAFHDSEKDSSLLAEDAASIVVILSPKEVGMLLIFWSGWDYEC